MNHVIGWILGLAVGATAQILPPYNLRVNHLQPSKSAGTPLAVVHNSAPWFSWALRHGRRGAVQTAYRLVLNRTFPGAPPVVVWDTGAVVSATSVGVQYGGHSPLASDADYAWTITWQDERGAWSSPPAPALFSTGLLAPENADWGGTAWVGGMDEADERNQMRRSFALPAGDPSVTDVRRARCYVSAPGCHETHLNGVRLQSSVSEGIEDAALGPTVQFSSKLPYDAYDCTSALRAGGAENVLASTLGRCWFALPDYGGLGYSTIGRRSLRVLITAELGSSTGATTAETTRWRLLGDGAGWKQARGPLVKDNLFLGVVLDGRRETPGWRLPGFNDSTWDPVPILHGPLHGRNGDGATRVPSNLLVLTDKSPSLVALPIPPIRRLAPRTPVSITVTKPGVALLDLGVNMAGTCEIVADDTSAAQPGDIMTMRHAEGLDAAGALDQTWLTSGPEISTYIFRADGAREVYSERFTYFGFRYLEVTGFPGGAAPPAEAVTCWFTHTDLEQSSTIDFISATGSNSSTAAMLNSLQAAITQSALSNFQSHPTDCPSREKRGWTGDGGHAAETLMLNFGMGGPYAKWLDDVDDASCASHHVPNIAPGNFHGQAHGDCFGGNDPGWGAGFIDVMNWHHRYVGDRSILARHYPAAVGYMSFLNEYVARSNSSNGLLSMANYGQFTALGDWCAPSGNALAPDGGHHLSNIIVGYFWIRQLEAMARASRVLGNVSAASGYTAQASEARTSFGRLYFDTQQGLFRDPDWVEAWGPKVMQTEQALAITLCLDLQDGYGDGSVAPAEIVPKADVARAAAALAASVSSGLDAGMVGIKHVFSALAATGHGDVALAALTRRTYPSYGYMLENGEGTLWERWEGGPCDLVHASRNHIMLGSPGQFLFQQVAGIDVGPGGVAFDLVAVAPMTAAAASYSGLGGVDATVGTPRGAVTVSWRSVPNEPDLCGEAAEKNDQGQPLHLDCGANSSISAIDFASYGTPNGTCADSSLLKVDPTCTAPTSVTVVRAACLGKEQCTLFANDTQFGGIDPCHGIAKRLAVTVTCSNTCRPHFTLNVTVPTGSNATVSLPFTPTRVKSMSAELPVVLTESGIPIYRNGTFLPGVAAGVTAVRGKSSSIEVTTGGGHYALALLQCTV